VALRGNIAKFSFFAVDSLYLGQTPGRALNPQNKNSALYLDNLLFTHPQYNLVDAPLV